MLPQQFELKTLLVALVPWGDNSLHKCQYGVGRPTNLLLSQAAIFIFTLKPVFISISNW